MKPAARGLVAMLLFAALSMGIGVWWRSQGKPMSDDGYVFTDIVRVAARVSGPVELLRVRNFRYYEAGDLLFEVDPEPYEVAMKEARAAVDQARLTMAATRSGVEEARAALIKAESGLVLARTEYGRRVNLREGVVSKSELDTFRDNFQAAEARVVEDQASLARAIAEAGPEDETNPVLQAALAQLDRANLELGFTQVLAPVSGFTSNLTLAEGSYVQEGQHVLTLLDDTAWRVEVSFREDQLRRIRPGQPAQIHLPAYPGRVFRGVVWGVGYGQVPERANREWGGLRSLDPTLDWVRLAQRLPVRVLFLDRDPEATLRMGISAVVRIDTTAEPLALQELLPDRVRPGAGETASGARAE